MVSIADLMYREHKGVYSRRHCEDVMRDKRTLRGYLMAPWYVAVLVLATLLVVQ